jgi:hypothetical protein
MASDDTLYDFYPIIAKGNVSEFEAYIQAHNLTLDDLVRNLVPLGDQDEDSVLSYILFVGKVHTHLPVLMRMGMGKEHLLGEEFLMFACVDESYDSIVYAFELFGVTLSDIKGALCPEDFESFVDYPDAKRLIEWLMAA